MTWLIWKEYRLNRLIVIVGAILLVVPHAIALFLAWRGAGPPTRGGEPQLYANLFDSVCYSLVLSQLTLLLLGGNAIACERADRSAEFLAYLPISRARILAGKLALVLLTAAVIWGLNLLILWFVVAHLPARGGQTLWHALPYIAITGYVFFSVGWLLSSLLESPTFAICGGLISPFLILTGVTTFGWLFEWPTETWEPWYRGASLTLASVCLVAGTWYYLRRVEP